MSPGSIHASLAYFRLAFGAGFVLGALRIPFVVPRLGERLARLVEMRIRPTTPSAACAAA